MQFKKRKSEKIRKISCQNLTFFTILISLVCTILKISPPILSQLLLTQFGPNLKGRFLGQSLKDSNCYDDIFPGNICPYQQCFSCYETFWNQFLGALIILVHIFFAPNYFLTYDILDLQFFSQ